MTNATIASDVAAEIGHEYVRHIKRGLLTRLTWRGWAVDIDGANVTVPLQDSAGQTTADLATLLGAAYRTIGTPIARGRGPLTRRRTILPAPMIGEIVAVLRSAQSIADTHWHWRSSTSTNALGRHGQKAKRHCRMSCSSRRCAPPCQPTRRWPITTTTPHRQLSTGFSTTRSESGVRHHIRPLLARRAPAWPE
jgi:hypothetical protein